MKYLAQALIAILLFSCGAKHDVELYSGLDVDQYCEQYQLEASDFRGFYRKLSGLVKVDNLNDLLSENNFQKLDYYKDNHTIVQFLGEDPGLDRCKVYFAYFKEGDYSTSMIVDRISRKIEIEVRNLD